MMYFKLAIRNLHSTVRQYMVYFLTLIFGVTLFYTFNSIGTQSIMLKMSSDQAAAFRSVDQIMGVVSFFLAFVLGFLVIYANKYMVRRRAKEFSIYLTLGMRRNKLALLIFIENFVVGLISLVTGIVVGLFASQLLAILTSYMFKIPFAHFKFVFSASSCAKTVGLFLVIYFAVFLFNAFSVRHLSIIDLMKQSQKAEVRLKLANSLYVLLFILSILLLSWADVSVWKLGIATLTGSKIIPYIVAGVLGTVLFFFAGTNLLLLVVQKCPRLYFRRLNPFVFRQISSEMTTSFISLSITCLMIFVAICMLAGGMGLNRAMTQGIQLATPYEGSIQSPVNIQQEMKKNRLSLSSSIEQVPLTIYNDSSVRANLFMTKKNKLLNSYYMFNQNQPVPLVSLSQVNQSRKLIQQPPIHLKNTQFLITGTRPEVENEINLQADIQLNGKILHSKDGKYHVMGLYDNIFAMDPLILIIPDEALKDAKPQYYYLNLAFPNSRMEKKVVQQFNSSSFMGELLTRQMVIDQSSVLGALASYLGIYIGFIFLMASAVLLSIQQLTKSSEDKKRYQLLAEIGATRSQRLSALRIQMLIFFGTPLILAFIHAIFGLHYANRIVSSIGNASAMTSIVLAVGIILLIYLGYFLLTYWNAKRNIE